MNKTMGLVLLIFLICNLGKAANVLQVKGNSAILELSDAEIETLQPEAGKKIRLISNGKQASANIKKISNKKILINTSANLVRIKTVQVADGGNNEGNEDNGSSKSRAGNSRGSLQKKWSLGANLQYVTGGSSIAITSLPSRTLKYNGFDISGVGVYYFDAIGVGARGDYTFGNGTTEVGSDKVTQVELSLLGEYKFKTFSVGALLAVFSNIHDTDNLNNDNSLNGFGYGLYATYDIYPRIKLLLNYKLVNYKLDPATYSTSDIRFGAGYYF